MNTSAQYLELLADDPGNPVFAACADDLRKDSRLAEGLEICLSGLSHNPKCHRGRLVLARIFYEQGYLPFAIREVEQLFRELPQSQAIKRLLEKLSPSSLIRETGRTTEGTDHGLNVQGNSVGSVESSKTTDDTEIDNTVAEADFDLDDLDLIGKK